MHGLQKRYAICREGSAVCNNYSTYSGWEDTTVQGKAGCCIGRRLHSECYHNQYVQELVDIHKSVPLLCDLLLYEHGWSLSSTHLKYNY